MYSIYRRGTPVRALNQTYAAGFPLLGNVARFIRDTLHDLGVPHPPYTPHPTPYSVAAVRILRVRCRDLVLAFRISVFKIRFSDLSF